MPVLSEKVRQQVKDTLKDMKDPVKLVVFTQEIECPTCTDNRQLMEEISSISEKISSEIYNFVLDKKKVELYQIDKIPATVVEGKKDYGIRFYGIPGGYEFTSLIHSIQLASSGDSRLSAEMKQQLQMLRKPVHIQVFVILTCPYCPKAVEIAHKMAIESDLIRSEMVNASEFPHLANKYQVFAVPKVIINESIQFEGALPEQEFLKYVMKAGE